MLTRLDTTPPFTIYTRSGDQEFTVFHPSDHLYQASVHGIIFRDEISELFVAEDERAKFHAYAGEHLGEILDDPLIPDDILASLLHGILSACSDRVLESSTRESLVTYRDSIVVFADWMLENDQAPDYLIPLALTSSRTNDHPVNVGIYAFALARELLAGNGKRHDFHGIAMGFFMHDVGQTAIPRDIIEKRGPLTEEEWAIIRTHPEKGVQILKESGIASKAALLIIRQHHERQNGSGYPEGLSNGDIHIYSRICAIADAFDAFTAERPYRDQTSSFTALETMYREMKQEFDPELFTQFVRLVGKPVPTAVTTREA